MVAQQLFGAIQRRDMALLNSLVEDQPELIDDVLYRGMNPLHIAVSAGSHEVVRFLLERRANPNALVDTGAQDYGVGQSIALQAREIITPQMHQELQQLGSISALHMAVKEEDLPMCELLLAFDATPTVMDQGGCYPLHWAVVREHKAICLCLLRAGAPVNCGDLVQNTPLHEAVRHQSVEIAEILLDRGADPHQQDLFNQTAIHLAEGHPAMQVLLLCFASQLPKEVMCH